MTGFNPDLAATRRPSRLSWLPNTLTMLRVALAPAVFALLAAASIDGRGFTINALTSPMTAWAAVLMLTAGVLDFLDGAAARALNVQSDFGRKWDPIADKVVNGAGLIGSSLILQLLWPAAAIIIVRDVLITRLRNNAPNSSKIAAPSQLSKWKTAFTFVGLIAFTGASVLSAIIALVLPGLAAGVGALSLWTGVITLYAAAALSLWTGWRYFSIARQD